jgi:hypothetical protein
MQGAATEDGGGARKEEVAASTPSLAMVSHTHLLLPTREFAIFMTVSRWFFYPTRLPLVSSSTLPAPPSRALMQPNRVPPRPDQPPGRPSRQDCLIPWHSRTGVLGG